MKGIVTDTNTKLVKEVYALVYTKRKRGRGRYPESCVTEVKTLEKALELSTPEQNLYPAKVLGPARSSEGFKVYYLIEWITQ